jgi:hypothetical protein
VAELEDVMTVFGCSLCRDLGDEFYPQSVEDHLTHAKQVHGVTKYDDTSWHTDSALELLGEIMGLPGKAARESPKPGV